MTSDEITVLVERELAEFAHDPPALDSGLLGVAWSSERIARGVEALRAGLVQPYPVSLSVPMSTRELDAQTEVREAWVVALPDGLLIVYDPVATEFALADPDGGDHATDLRVRGDLVGTFLAA